VGFMYIRTRSMNVAAPIAGGNAHSVAMPTSFKSETASSFVSSGCRNDHRAGRGPKGVTRIAIESAVTFDLALINNRTPANKAHDHGREAC